MLKNCECKIPTDTIESPMRIHLSKYGIECTNPVNDSNIGNIESKIRRVNSL